MADNLKHDLKIFAGRANPLLVNAICSHLGLAVGRARVESFPDGEVIVKLEEDVRGRDCFIVQPTCPPVNDNLVELLVWIDCLMRASATRITAVIPYFGYARQDRKSEGRTPITAKMVANIITAAGVDRVIAMDLHAAQVQGFFDLPVDHLLASPVFLAWYRRQLPQLGRIAIVSPDPGNLKAASYYAEMLGGDLAFIDKRRQSGTQVFMSTIVGDIVDKTVLMFDDMITTGGTVAEASKILMDRGAKAVHIAATHGIFAGAAVDRIAASPISKIVITDTVPMDSRLDPIRGRLEVLSISDLLGEAIRRIHLNESVSSLFDKGGNGGKR
jgi:ribose-phosphate pyrophosphokinase